MENFVSQDFAPGAAEAAAVIDRAKAGARIGVQAMQSARTGRSATRAPVTESKAANAMNTVATYGNMPVTGEFAGMAGGFVIGKVVGLASKNAEVAIRTNVLAPFSAMRKTSWNNLGAFRAHFHGSVHEHAMKIAAEAADKGNTKLHAAAQARANAAASRVAAHARTIKPVEAAMPITAKAGEGMGAKLSWRAGKLAEVHAKHVGKASAALTTEVPGFFANIRNKITFKTPKTIDLHPQLAGIASDLRAAENITCSAARANHMRGVCEQLSAMAQGESAVAKQAAHVLRSASKAHGAASAAHGYAEAATRGLKGLGGMFMKSAGRMSVFGTLIAVGTTATIGAAWLHAKHAHAQDKSTLDQMAADIGPEGAGYMALVQKASGKHTLSNAANTGLLTVGHAATGKMIAASQQAAVGGGMMAVSMLPMFVSEATQNPVAAAYQALGNPEMTKDQRVLAIKQLFAVKPSVEAHGGMYNRLNDYMARQLVEKNTSREAVIRLAANDAEFNKFAAEMNAKMQAAAAPKAPKTEHPTQTAHAPVRPVHAGVSLAGAEYKGRVAANHDLAAIRA